MDCTLVLHVLRSSLAKARRSFDVKIVRLLPQCQPILVTLQITEKWPIVITHQYILFFLADDSPGDSDVYQYASASYQLGHLSPPPPPPPPDAALPPNTSMNPHPSYSGGRLPFGDEGEHQQMSFASLVYQVPSLNNVDSANRVSSYYEDSDYNICTFICT